MPKPKKADIEKGNKIIQAMDSQEAQEVESLLDYDGLNDRQKTIAKMRLRGLSQKAIASFLGVSQPIVSRECKRIREHMRKKGAAIDQDRVVGEAVTKYEEVQHRAWEIFHNANTESDKLKALSTIMAAEEKHIKLLMDLGKIERVGNVSKVELVSPLVQEWNEGKKNKVIEAIVETTLSDLEAPQPPDFDYEVTNDEEE